MNTDSPSPPAARREPRETTLHGHVLQDDYAWLRDRESAEVREYLEAENRYTAAVMARLQPLEERLYAEMLSHIRQTDVSVPYLRKGFYYFSRTEEGKQYPIYCRRRAALEAGEEIVLDVNRLAEGESFLAVGAMAASDDSRLLAYTTDNTGFRQYTLHVKDLESGAIVSSGVERVGSLAWAADSRTLFYTVEDEEQKRQYRLYRHRLGEAHSSDVLVFEETDERFNIAVGRTRDGRYLMLESASHTTSEQHFLSAENPQASWQRIAPRIEEQEYYAEHRNGVFYIRSNDRGRNFRLLVAPVSRPGREQWQELLPHRDAVMLEDVEVFSGFLVYAERARGLEQLRVARFRGEGPETAEPVEIRFPEPAYSARPQINAEFETGFFRYSYQSLVTPASVFDYDVAAGTSTLLKQQEVPGGFDRSLYASERIFARAEDGAEIPVSLVYRRDRRSEGGNPLYVYGYGSYGYALPLGFQSNRLCLLDRGLVLAYAHIRGGGDMGKSWHDAGRLLSKRNTFTDFLRVVETLTSRGYGDPKRVAIEGGSAGGLLMGAVVNMAPPGFFRAVLSHVPFVDVMNTMLDATLPLTVPEYEEWGDPAGREAFEYMLSYSPYDNLVRREYPAMLVKTSLYDSQVMYWEPAKYVARLRTLKTDSNPLLLYTNMSAGHGGASGRYDYLREIAFDYAFLLDALGVES